MIRKLLGKEEFGAVVVLVSKGDGPPSPGRFLSGVLSNPIPRRAAGAPSSPAPRQQTVA